MLAHPAVRHGTLLTTLLPAPLGRLSLQGSCNGIRAYLPRHLWPDADHEEAQLPNSVGAEERVGNEAVLTLLILPGLLLSSFVSCHQPKLSTFLKSRVMDGGQLVMLMVCAPRPRRFLSQNVACRLTSACAVRMIVQQLS